GAAGVAMAGFRRTVHRGRQARPAHRRKQEAPEPRRQPAADPRRRPRRVPPGPHRPRHRGVPQGQRRLPDIRPPRSASQSIGRAIDAYFKANGGFLSYDDLAAHHGEWVEPVSTNYRGHDVWELPPNGQGIAALQILNLLEPYDLAGYGFGSPEHVHLFVEAKKLAFADRAASYADPDFHRIPVERLVSKEYARERGRLISLDRAMPAAEPGVIPQLNEGDTIYLTTADADGMMVSLIQSNYRGMGSGMAPPGLGFILQDRGEQFV